LSGESTTRSRYWATAILTSVVILYVVAYSVLSVARYDTFHATTFDLGIMTQVIWNTAHGRWFETSLGRAINAELIGSYMGNHVRPFLLLLVPFYHLWPDPRLLLVLQSIALGGAAVPLYYVTQRRANDPRFACVVALCYLAYPALGFLNLFDFHPVAFSIPCIFFAYWALLEQRGGMFWIAVLLALFTKEEMVVPLGTWGLVNLLQREKRRVGLGLLALAVGWAGLCFGVIIPCYNDGQPYRFWDLWSSLFGLSVRGAVQGGAARLTIGTSSDTTILFLLHLVLPVGFLPFLGPSALAMALPSLAYLLIGKRPAFHSVGYQYPAVLIPWFFLAVGEGLARLRRIGRWARRRQLQRLGLAFLLVGTVGINVPLNPIALYARSAAFQPGPSRAQIVEALAQIPPGAGVATVNRLGPALANRRVLVAFEYPPPFRLDHIQQAEYVLLDLVDCRTVPTPDQRAGYAEMVAQVLQTEQFGVRYWSDRTLLLERRAVPSKEKLADVMAYVDDLVEQDRPCWP
jgi:uncharacterized membrane protein